MTHLRHVLPQCIHQVHHTQHVSARLEACAAAVVADANTTKRHRPEACAPTAHPPGPPLAASSAWAAQHLARQQTAKPPLLLRRFQPAGNTQISNSSLRVTQLPCSDTGLGRVPRGAICDVKGIRGRLQALNRQVGCSHLAINMQQQRMQGS
jgi:hypothetical protein